jgi:chromosome segregation ATPase
LTTSLIRRFSRNTRPRLAEASDAPEAADRQRAELEDRLEATQQRIRALESSEARLKAKLEDVEKARDEAIAELERVAGEVDTLRETVTTQAYQGRRV